MHDRSIAQTHHPYVAGVVDWLAVTTRLIREAAEPGRLVRYTLHPAGTVVCKDKAVAAARNGGWNHSLRWHW
jgi:hypothetical protein